MHPKSEIIFVNYKLFLFPILLTQHWTIFDCTFKVIALDLHCIIFVTISLLFRWLFLWLLLYLAYGGNSVKFSFSFGFCHESEIVKNRIKAKKYQFSNLFAIWPIMDTIIYTHPMVTTLFKTTYFPLSLILKDVHCSATL